MSRVPSSRDLGWAAVWFAVALVLRTIHLLTVRDSPFFSILYIDPLMYDEWGMRVAAGNLLSDKPFFLDPLYSYFLGAIFAIAGHHYEAVVAVQSLLGALVAPLVLLAARPWFDASTARAAAGVAAVYLPGIYFGGLLMKPGLAMFLTTVALWLLSRALCGGGGRAVWPWIGVVLGLACLTRGNLLLVLPVIAAWLLLRAPVDQAADGAGLHTLAARARSRSRWGEVCGVALGAGLVLVLPAIHNYVVGKELILTTANAGANFYIGNNPSNSSGEYQQLPFINANPKYEQRDFLREAERRSGRELTDREASAFWFGESLAWVREHPGDWIALLWRKVRSFWGAWEIPDSVDYYLYREYAPVLRMPIPGFGLLAPLAFVGAALAIRRRGWPRLLLVLVATYSATIVLFFVFSRFRMIVAPALYVLAGHAAVEITRAWRRALREGASWLPAGALTASLLVAWAFVNVPVRARTDGWAHAAASRVGLPTRPETSALGHHNLGLAYAREAKDAADEQLLLKRAEAEMRTALELQGPANHARVEVELAKVLSRQGRNREAIDLYRAAADIEPNDYRIYRALGILYRRENRLDAAVAMFRRALQLAPTDVGNAIRLGQVLVDLDRSEDAARAFEHALRLAPDNREARMGLETTRRRHP